MNPHRIPHLLLDRRNPLFIPLNYLESAYIEGKIEKVKLAKELDFALTFDIEYGESIPKKEADKKVNIFLKEIEKLLNKNKMNATFFVQGDLVLEHKKILKRLEKKHELGLHGYSHEVWGKNWFIEQELVSIEEREKRIKKSLDNFRKAKLKRPISFRAPYMVIDSDSLNILKKNKFEIDSSAPSYKGIAPIINRKRGIKEIPVSVDPVHKIRFNRVPYSEYEVFNMRNLSCMDKNELNKYSERVLKIQKLFNQKPFLVFLAHPWEFKSKKDYKILEDMINLIKKKYKVKTVKINEL